MNHRIHAQILIVATLGLAACSAPEGSSTQAAAAFTYPDGSPHPVTPWGEPDLQGNWPIMHLFATRLQRDPKYGERRELNDEEWQAAQAGLQRRDERYHEEIQGNKMGMGHWAETTTRTEAARLTSLISYPPNGQLPALTARGQELAPLFRSDDTQQVFDSVQDFDAWDRCITRGLPASMLPFNYNNGIRIHQAPGYVVIDLEMIHEARVVPMRPRRRSIPRSSSGWASRAATGKAPRSSSRRPISPARRTCSLPASPAACAGPCRRRRA